jgi:monoamine oxidase
MSALTSGSDRRPHVLVIGAGAAGLSAARHIVDAASAPSTKKLPKLSRAPKRARAAAAAPPARVVPTVMVLEARDRPGGRVLTATLAARDGLPAIPVDVGASIMHGCGDSNQSVFRRAVEKGIRAPTVAGGTFYECTEHARWFGDDGVPLGTRVVAEMHALFWLIGRCLAVAARTSEDSGMDLKSKYDEAKKFVLENATARAKTLTREEEAVLEKIRIRSFAYCSPMEKMALHQAAVGVDPRVDLGGLPEIVGLTEAGGEAVAGDGGRPKELRPRSIKRAATILGKRVECADNPVCAVASRRPYLTPDRIVVDGYTPFLIDDLVTGLDVRYGTVAAQVDYRWKGGRGRDVVGRSAKDGYCVRVTTKDSQQYFADFVVVTLPLGVLQTNDERSCVQFAPRLSLEKLAAINGLGMGVHNKVILRFAPEDVFWPPGSPQLNCLDPRFQFLNLNAYDKPGVLLTHVFGGTSFARGYDGLDNDAVVAEVLRVLKAMFYADDMDEGAEGSSPQSVVDEVIEATGVRVVPGADGTHLLAVGEEAFGLSLDAASDFESEVDSERQTRQAGDSKRATRRRTATPERKVESSEPTTIYRPARKPESFPAPIDTIVTRWDQDPFALGSYSYLPCNGEWDMITELARPEPRTGVASLFFAGEHCDDLGWQCVHGACESGINAASIIMGITNDEPVETLREPFAKVSATPNEKFKPRTRSRQTVAKVAVADGANRKVRRSAGK